MKIFYCVFLTLMAWVAPAFATVSVSSPAPGATVTSPVHYVATATTSTCSKGVASMGIYVNNKLIYVVDATKLDHELSLATGAQHTVVEEWDHCGGASYTTINLTVKSSTPPAPTVSISSSPTSISKGGSSTLTVKATNATQVTVTGSDGSSYTLSTSGGTQVVSPTTTTTYTAKASGSSGTASATATVTVNQSTAPTVSVAANPTSITKGGSSTLTVTATNATQVTVSGSDGSKYTLQSNGGTQAVSPTTTTTYTATASGAGGTASATATVTVNQGTAPTVTIAANPASITEGGSSTLTVTATNATQVTVTGSDGSSYTMSSSGGTQAVTPTTTTTYTADVTGSGGTASANTTVTVTPAGGSDPINHVIFMLQENHSFDDYFGMLNPYRRTKGWTTGDDGQVYTVDGIDDKLNTSNVDDEGVSIPLFKLKSTCIDDDSSSWLESYGDVNRYNFLTTRPILMDGFVHIAEGFAKSCASSGTCSGQFTDTTGERAMGYYDEGFLNYYYYMASQFALSDRWFSPVSSKSAPNRVATFTGGTTQGLAFDPGSDDHVSPLTIQTIFQELDTAGVSWKVYYTVTDGFCLAGNTCGTGSGNYPATYLNYFTYFHKYLYQNSSHAACTGTTKASSVVGDTSNYFCIDTNHVAPLTTYYTDLKNGTLPSFSFIEAGSGVNDEHPGSGASILNGQVEVAKVMNAFMTSPEWKDSAFFFAYDEGGGPYDHVPPVPGHSNDKTDASLGTIPDISAIAVSPDGYKPCVPSSGTATTHCDLKSSSPGAHSGDAAAVNGFAAQLGFRLPNMVISPFSRRHYVSHIPMDHTAVIKFVENRFIGGSAHLTARDAAQPDLLNFFDFNNVPWATPPTPPAPVTASSLGYNPCTPASMGP
jgi:phospholipase C